MALTKVLEFINEIRKEQGRRPLRKMPKGVPGDPFSCPIATGINHAFKAEVDGFCATYRDADGKRQERSLTVAASNFVGDFDTRRYPELIDQKRTEISLLKNRKMLITEDLRMYRKCPQSAAITEQIAILKAGLTEVNKKLKKLEKK